MSLLVVWLFNNTTDPQAVEITGWNDNIHRMSTILRYYIMTSVSLSTCMGCEDIIKICHYIDKSGKKLVDQNIVTKYLI